MIHFDSTSQWRYNKTNHMMQGVKRNIIDNLEGKDCLVAMFVTIRPKQPIKQKTIITSKGLLKLDPKLFSQIE